MTEQGLYLVWGTAFDGTKMAAVVQLGSDLAEGVQLTLATKDGGLNARTPYMFRRITNSVTAGQ